MQEKTYNLIRLTLGFVSRFVTYPYYLLFDGVFLSWQMLQYYYDIDINIEYLQIKFGNNFEYTMNKIFTFYLGVYLSYLFKNNIMPIFYKKLNGELG